MIFLSLGIQSHCDMMRIFVQSHSHHGSDDPQKVIGSLGVGEYPIKFHKTSIKFHMILSYITLYYHILHMFSHFHGPMPPVTATQGRESPRRLDRDLERDSKRRTMRRASVKVGISRQMG